MKKFISQIITDFLKKNGISKASLAKELGESAQNLGKKLSNNDIGTDYVMRICDALSHDFFKDLSSEYQRTKGLISVDEFDRDMNTPTRAMNIADIQKDLTDKIEKQEERYLALLKDNTQDKNEIRQLYKQLLQQKDEIITLLEKQTILEKNSTLPQHADMAKLKKH